MRAELRKIVGWLRRIGAGRTPKPLEFTEPNLAFECVRNDEHAEIRVWFQGEVRPIWAGHDDPWARDLSLDLTVARADVLEAADALGAEVDAIEAS
jgi:hypothetical protein